MRLTRRRLLGWTAAAGVTATAGCGSDERSLGLHAVNAQIIHQAGSSQLDYPADVGVRVTVENTAPERKAGTLVATLEHVDDADSETPTVVDSWTRRRQLSLAGGTTRSFLFVFEGAFDDGDDEDAFRARATI